MNRWRTDIATLVLRLAFGLIFIPHGYSKVFGAGGVAAFAQSLPDYGIPSALGYVAAYSELGGGILLIPGLLTRVAALFLAGTMFVATFVVQLPDALHDPQAGKLKALAVIQGIELPLAILAAMLALVVLGGGRFSLDALIGSWRKKKAATEPPPR